MQSNWQLGKRGFQSSLDQTKMMELLLVFSQNGWKLEPARKMLAERYEVELNPRTIGRYKRDLKALWERVDHSLDDTAEWADFSTLADLGIPPGRLRQLHSMWRTIERAYLKNDLIPIRPTYRSVRWWAFVIEYYGEIIGDLGDRIHVAEQYTTREMVNDLLEGNVGTDDLDKWLLYQPWENPQKEADYLQDISVGVIDPLDETRARGSFMPLKDGVNETQHSSQPEIDLAAVNKLLADAAKPYLLPSQILNELTEKTTERIARALRPTPVDSTTSESSGVSFSSWKLVE